MPKYLPANKKLRILSQNLRNFSTPEERHLWYDFLRQYPIQFNRQKIIGDYIADFFCKRAALVVELDGSQHRENAAVDYDAQRTAYFSELGISVLRFSNEEVRKDFQTVCRKIDFFVQTHLSGAGMDEE